MHLPQSVSMNMGHIHEDSMNIMSHCINYASPNKVGHVHNSGKALLSNGGRREELPLQGSGVHLRRESSGGSGVSNLPKSAR